MIMISPRHASYEIDNFGFTIDFCKPSLCPIILLLLNFEAISIHGFAHKMHNRIIMNSIFCLVLFIAFCTKVCLIKSCFCSSTSNKSAQSLFALILVLQI